MECKKNPKMVLETKRSQFFMIGLIVSLSLTITAFEWKTKEDAIVTMADISRGWEDPDEIPLTVIPPPEPPKPKVIPNVIVETEEEVEVPEALVIDIEEIPLDEPIIIDLPEEEVEDSFVYDVVESMPEPVGGMGGFYAFLAKEMKYPKQARRMGIEGKVYIQFIIDETGTLTNIELMRGIGAGCDEEAKRVLSLTPAWTPGKQRGRPVKVRMIVPVFFKLR